MSTSTPSVTEKNIDALIELSRRLRRVIHLSQKLHSDEQQTRELINQTKALEAALEKHTKEERLVNIFGLSKAVPRNAKEWSLRLPYGNISGALNPLAPPIEITYAEDGTQKLMGTTTLGLEHEGPPNSVNGGTIASIYDHFLAFATMALEHGGPTASLEILYRNKTPLNQQLRFEAWIDRIEGKKMFVKGHCYAGDMLCTEANALFINLLFKS